jgi:hypothetical protein
VAAAPRKARDRERREQTGERHPRQRPPNRRTPVSDIARKILEHPDLDRMDKLEETPGRDRNDQADEGREHEQDPVSPASNQGNRIDRQGDVGAHPEREVFFSTAALEARETLSLPGQGRQAPPGSSLAEPETFEVH